MPDPIAEIKRIGEDIGRTFEEYKDANDKRVAELEKGVRGVADIDEKLAKMDSALDAMTESKEAFEADLRKSIDEALEKMQSFKPGGDIPDPKKEEYRQNFVKWIRSGGRDMSLGSDLGKLEKEIPEYAALKAVSTATGAAGGFAVPEEIDRRIGEQLRELSPMRDLITVREIGTSDYKELLNVHGGAVGWVGETDTRSETGTASLRERTPTMGTLYAYPKATEESLEDIFFNVEDWIVDEVTEDMAIEEANQFVNGDGTNKPTGMLDTAPVATDDDASPARDVDAFEYVPLQPNTSPVNATTIESDEIWTIVYLLKSRYAVNASWIMKRSTIGLVRKIKDGDNDYLWRPGLAAGQPDELAGYPLRSLDVVPTAAVNAIVMGFGDWKRAYHAVDRVGLRITVDNNITTPGYVKFYVRRRVGGNVYDNQAAKFGKMSAS